MLETCYVGTKASYLRSRKEYKECVKDYGCDSGQAKLYLSYTKDWNERTICLRRAIFKLCLKTGFISRIK